LLITEEETMTQLKNIAAAACFILLGLVMQDSAVAQNYPAKIVRVLIPFAPGSASDTLGRLVLQEFQAVLGGTYVAENKTGANGMIAAEEVARSAPDGYTLFFTSNSTQHVNPGLFKNLRYDPRKDFTPIAQLMRSYYTLIVNNNVPAKSVAELVAIGKADPKRLSYAMFNGMSLITSELFKVQAGIEVGQVSYKASSTAYIDLQRGDIPMMFADSLNSTPLINAGKVRALAVSGGKRATLLPNVPTMQEVGFPGFVVEGWVGLLGPARMDPNLVKKLNEIITNAMNNKGLADRIKAMGFMPVTSTAQQFGEFHDTESVRWAAFMKSAKIEPQ
jgi:tripartite-type tricarboxylate transporter receptor subunit TctC